MRRVIILFFTLFLVASCNLTEEQKPIEETTTVAEDASLEETGLLHKENWPYEAGVTWISAVGDPVEPVPYMWDFLDLGKASEVKVNSQQCGDCWSQATTKALELMIAARDEELVQLSVQTQISRCSNHGSCWGGYMSAPSWIVQNGNPYETQDPYRGYNTSCKFTKTEIEEGFERRPESAPYVGTSLQNSRYFRSDAREGAKVAEIKRLMWELKSPAVATIQGIRLGKQVYEGCSAINSVGNHMQVITGWYPHVKGWDVAEAFNSWGYSHGFDGVSRIRWECGDGRLNRGLGRSARVYVYKAPCDPPTVPQLKGAFAMKPNEKAWLGEEAPKGQTCEWLPKAGIVAQSEDGCRVQISPQVTTEYHIQSRNNCGLMTSAMMLVEVDGRADSILTPHGMVAR